MAELFSKYRKPTINTVTIPERTSYACNFHTEGCPHSSNVVGFAVCGGPAPGGGNFTSFGLGACR